MAMTMTQKILAAHAGLESVKAGQLIEANLDLVLGNDITSPVAVKEFQKFGVKKVFDKDKIAIVPDHFTPNKDIKAAEQCKFIREFSREKGITNLFFEFPVTIPQIKSLRGGIVLNAVCDKCEVEIESNKDFIDFATSRKYINCDIVDNGKIMKLTFKGKTAHGSTPEKGINAALMALKALGQFYEYAKLVDIADNFSVYNGKAINGYSKGKYLGESTFNVGTISIEDNVLKLGVNYRFPEDVSVENTISRIKEVFNAKITHDEISPYLLLNPQSKLIQTLMKAYYRETGDKTPIFTIGGGTYAKHAKNTVAFGAMFPYSVDTMHQPDEYMNLDDLFKASVIYCRAIDTLGKLK